MNAAINLGRAQGSNSIGRLIYLLVATLLLLGACGGDSGPTPAPPPAGTDNFVNAPVNAADSPVAGTQGVKSTMGSATVYLLTEQRTPQDTTLRIEINAAHTSIRNMVVSESIIHVTGMVRTSDVVHVLTPEAVETIYRCNGERMECVEVPFHRTASGVSFLARADGFFALRK